MGPRSQSEHLVLLEDVAKTYRMGEIEVAALRDVSLSVGEGEFVVILGPSGCGKSTLMNIVGGLDTPTAGRVLIQGEDISKYDENQLTLFRRNKVGFIFQFFNLVTTLTVRENVQLVSEMSENPRDVDEVLQAVGLAERATHFPSELSGGEQQRTAIARALVKNAPLLLCDEPTGELDFETGRMVLSLLHQITHERGQTVMMVTHNAAVANIADRVLKLRSGAIISDEINKNPVDPEGLVW